MSIEELRQVGREVHEDELDTDYIARLENEQDEETRNALVHMIDTEGFIRTA